MRLLEALAKCFLEGLLLVLTAKLLLDAENLE